MLPPKIILDNLLLLNFKILYFSKYLEIFLLLKLEYSFVTLYILLPKLIHSLLLYFLGNHLFHYGLLFRGVLLLFITLFIIIIKFINPHYCSSFWRFPNIYYINGSLDISSQNTSRGWYKFVEVNHFLSYYFWHQLYK